MVNSLLSITDVQHDTIVPNHHEANGFIERANQSIRKTLEKLLREFNEKKYRPKWNELLPAVQFAMDIRVHRVNQAAPFVLMFGRHPFRFFNELQEGDRNLLEQFWKSYHREIPKVVRDFKIRY